MANLQDPKQAVLNILQQVLPSPAAFMLPCQDVEEVHNFLQDDAAKRIVIIGDFGAGKSSLLRALLDGSLKAIGGAWTSSFSLRRSGDAEAETNKVCLRSCTLPKSFVKLLIMDTPDLNGSKEPEQDQKHIREIASSINQMRSVHGIILVLKNESKMSNPLREVLTYLQRIFGEDMWSRTALVVNRLRHDTLTKTMPAEGNEFSSQEFASEFRQTLQKPPRLAAAGEHCGLGLTTEEAAQPSFFFMDTHYDLNDPELARLIVHLESQTSTMNSCATSAGVQQLINAVNADECSDNLQTKLNSALRAMPMDLTRRKIQAMWCEISRKKAEESLLAFAGSDDQAYLMQAARQFLEKFDESLECANDCRIPKPEYLSPIQQLMKGLCSGETSDLQMPTCPSFIRMSDITPQIMRLQERCKTFYSRLPNIFSSFGTLGIDFSDAHLRDAADWLCANCAKDDDMLKFLTKADEGRLDNFIQASRLPHRASVKLKVYWAALGLENSGPSTDKEKWQKLLFQAKLAKMPETFVEYMENLSPVPALEVSEAGGWEQSWRVIEGKDMHNDNSTRDGVTVWRAVLANDGFRIFYKARTRAPHETARVVKEGKLSDGTALKKPDRFICKWNSKQNKESFSSEATCSLWQAVPPAGYVALSDVAVTRPNDKSPGDFEDPDQIDPDFRCVHESLVEDSFITDSIWCSSKRYTFCGSVWAIHGSHGMVAASSHRPDHRRKVAFLKDFKV
eukprot:s119_g60.t1